jgi:tryptophan synthase beta subunit
MRIASYSCRKAVGLDWKDKGHFEQYGSVFIAVTLMTAVTELKEAYEKY